MVTCQSANQLKTPANVSWAFKMVSQFVSLGYTIMGKTADLTVVQKTIIDTLHKEGKPLTFIAKEAGCSQSAVSKHVNRTLSRRKKCGRKRCTTNRNNFMRIVKQNRFTNLGELHKEWTEAGVKASRATTHRRVNEFGYSCHQRCLTWAKKKKNWTVTQWSKVLFSDESKFCISFGNQGPRVWRKGGGPLFFENQRHCTRLPRNFTLRFLLLTSFLKMLISFSSRIWHLATLPKAPKIG